MFFTLLRFGDDSVLHIVDRLSADDLSPVWFMTMNSRGSLHDGLEFLSKEIAIGVDVSDSIDESNIQSDSE